MKRIVLSSLLLLIFLIPSLSKAQCGFDVVREKQLLDPAFVLQEQANELRIKSFTPPINVTGKVGSVLTIPVVVHVLHKGEAVGSGTNISDAQIQSGIDRLNEVYRGLDPSSPIDFEIEFSLAQRDPSCNNTTGINRILATGVAGYSADGVFLQSTGADENELKDLSRWSETDYFNVWIVSEIDGNGGGSGIQGYANFYNGNAYEGSVMMASVFGYDPGNTNGWGLNSNGDGSTVVHEFGHYFHLYHTFQGDNDGVSCPGDAVVGTDSDGCADTETHKRYTSTCPTNNDCNGNNPYGLNTRNNYMSYFSCTDRLTADQKTRVTAAMTGTSIVSSKGALAPDGPFSPPLANSCTPQTDVNWGLDGNYSGIGTVEIKDVVSGSGYPATDNPSTGTLDQSVNCQKLITVDVSELVSISVTTLFNSGNNIKAYVDYDNSGNFDGTEEVFSKTGVAAFTTSSGDFTIPITATTGTTLRLRVIQDLNAISGPCHNSQYGQAEDYAIYINPVAGSAPVADFSASSISICKGGSVTFTDESTESPTSWSWSFAGGTPSTSTSQNPTIIYNTAGTFSVTLTATNAFGSDPETKTSYITVNDLPNLSSTSSTDETCTGNDGTATVTPSPVGTYTYSWNTAPVQNTSTATGLAAATYNVTVTNTATTCFASTDVVVNDGCLGSAPVADFTAGQTTICEGISINFTDASTNAPTSWLWNFGDGDTSTIQNPSHIYATAGNYTVTLTATNAFGNDDEVKTNYITVNSCGVTQLRGMDCGITLPDYNTYVKCDYVAGATQYEYEITNVGLGYSQTVIRSSSYRFIYLGTASGILSNTTYDIRVRAKVGGVFGSYGTTCQVTTPPNNFSTQLMSQYCNSTLSSYSQFINCAYLEGSTEYEYEITNAGLGFSQTILRPSSYRFLYMSAVTGISDGTTYDVRVRAKINGVFTSYGSSCQVTTPASFTTQLRSSDCGKTLPDSSTYIICDYVSGATEYQYEIINFGSSFIDTITRSSNYRFIYLNSVTGVQYNKTYDIRVRAYVNETWTSFGSMCQVTTAGSSIIGGGDVVSRLANNNKAEGEIVPTRITIYPNPNQGEYLFVELSDLTPNSELIVTDIYGKQIERMIIDTEESNYNTTVRFTNKLSSGFYLVTVQSNGQSITKKLIVR